MVSVNLISMLVNRNTSVRISVKSKTHVKMFFFNEFFKSFNMGRTALLIYIDTVRRCTYKISMCPQRIKYGFGNHPGSTVCTVQTDAQIFVGM